MGSPWAPYGDFRRRLGAQVAAQGHKKADAGPHSVSNAVNSATADVPGVAFCHENIVNNGVLTTAPFSQTCSKRVAQGGPKVSCGGPFGHLGSSRGASWSTLDTTGRQQDAALRTDAFPGPKLVPDPLPKRASAAGAQRVWRVGKTHICPSGECFRLGKTTIQQKYSFAAAKRN